MGCRAFYRLRNNCTSLLTNFFTAAGGLSHSARPPDGLASTSGKPLTHPVENNALLDIGAGNETFTRRVSRCFPNTFFAEVASEDLNCSLVFCPRQQVRLKKSTDGHRPPLRTPESHTVRLRPPRTRTHHRPPRSRLVHPSIVRPRTILCRYIRMPGKHDRLGHRYVPLDVVQRLPSPRAL